MKNKTKYYSVGQVSKICNVSANTLRFYDKIGLIHPDKIGENNYRFYSKETLTYIPVIKYYKQMGFSLEEIKEIVDENSFVLHEKLFKEKSDKLKEMKDSIYKKYAAIEGWLQLITEAEMIRKNDVRQVSLKYVQPSTFCCMEQHFNYNYKEAIINIDFTNYIESIGNEAAGVLMLNFPSIDKKLNKEESSVTVMQQLVLATTGKTQTKIFGGQVFASCYHLGPHETIENTYLKILQWASENQYTCAAESYERFLIDYWTTKNPDFFVTEILVQVEKLL